MSNAMELLRELCRGNLPTDLRVFFEQTVDGSLTGHEILDVNVLSLDDAVGLSLQFRAFEPHVAILGGVVLDDANTSNHHVYLSLPVCNGSVLYLSHDGDASIVFPSLNAFLEACRKAIESGESVTSFHVASGVVLPDQKGVSDLVNDLSEGRTHKNGRAVVPSLIPSMDLRDFALLSRIAANDDFYIGESVARAITLRPHPDLKPLAEICARHPHVQVNGNGKLALQAIARSK